MKTPKYHSKKQFTNTQYRDEVYMNYRDYWEKYLKRFDFEKVKPKRVYEKIRSKKDSLNVLNEYL